MVEEWRTVENYPAYEVSNFGNVRRTIPSSRGGRCKPGRYLGYTTRYGYKSVNLCKDGKYWPYAIHRLVALAFIGEPPTPRHQIAHGDGTRTNNRADNLRWATPHENSLDRAIHGTQQRGERVGTSKLSERQAIEILKSDKPQTELSQIYGVSSRTVGLIKRGKSWKYLQQGER